MITLNFYLGSKAMKTSLLVFSIFLCLCNAVAFADAPKEAIVLNPSVDPKAPSISVQGLGNKILDAAGSAKYLVFDYNGKQYAYSIKRLGSGDVRYSGKPSDIEGLVFFDVTAYQDGRKLNSQLTTYRQSKYANAIRLEKFDRNEERPYQFDLGIDSSGELMIIDGRDNVIYLTKQDKIKEPISLKEKYKQFIY